MQAELGQLTTQAEALALELQQALQREAEARAQAEQERARLETAHREEVGQLQQEAENRFAELKANHLQFFQKVEQNLGLMSEKQQEEVQAYLVQLEEARVICIQSEARLKEESAKARELQREVERASRENRILRESMREVRLELENKERNYTKIFVNAQSEDERRQAQERESREREAREVREVRVASRNKGAQSVVLARGKSRQRSLVSGRVQAASSQQMNPLIQAISHTRELK